VGRFGATVLGLVGVASLGCQRQVETSVNPKKDDVNAIRPPSALLEPGTIVLRTSPEKAPSAELEVLCDAVSVVGPDAPLEVRPAPAALEKYLAGEATNVTLTDPERVFLPVLAGDAAVRAHRTEACTARLREHLDDPVAMVRLVVRGQTSDARTVTLWAGFDEGSAFVDLPWQGGRGLLDDSVQSEVSKVKSRSAKPAATNVPAKPKETDKAPAKPAE